MNRVTLITGTIPWAGSKQPDTPYDELAAAIVYQAVKDHVKAQQKLWKPDLTVKEKRKLVLQKVEIEDFFHSQWYEALTDLDADLLITQCRLMAKEQEKQARERANKRAIKKMMKEKKERLSGENPKAFSVGEK